MRIVTSASRPVVGLEKRTHGSARGTIDNEIGQNEDGALTLTFTFRIVIDGDYRVFFDLAPVYA